MSRRSNKDIHLVTGIVIASLAVDLLKGTLGRDGNWTGKSLLLAVAISVLVYYITFVEDEVKK